MTTRSPIRSRLEPQNHMRAVGAEELTITKAKAGDVPKHNARFQWFQSSRETFYETMKYSSWEANLYVFTRNIFKLMRDGFYIKLEDEVQNTGCVTVSICPGNFQRDRWKHSRRWVFADSEQNWTAHLAVCAESVGLLGQCPVESLLDGGAKPLRVFAWNREGFLIYHYWLLEPGHNLHTINVDTVMKGLWPWPKESDFESPTLSLGPGNAGRPDSVVMKAEEREADVDEDMIDGLEDDVGKELDENIRVGPLFKRIYMASRNASTPESTVGNSKEDEDSFQRWLDEDDENKFEYFQNGRMPETYLDEDKKNELTLWVGEHADDRFAYSRLGLVPEQFCRPFSRLQSIVKRL